MGGGGVGGGGEGRGDGRSGAFEGLGSCMLDDSDSSTRRISKDRPSSWDSEDRPGLEL
jgi:hypothetical protein